MARRGDLHRLTRWLWTSRRPEAQAARVLLLPVSGLWLAAVRSRAALFRSGVLERRALPVPSIAVGNLTLGASGQAPIIRWIARYYADHGVVPGIVHSGASGLDAPVVRHALPAAIVATGPGRAAAARLAAAEGAQVLILDDAFQRLDFRHDMRIAVLAAESGHAVPWTVPAGPWREPFEGVDSADAVVITRRRATAAAALELADRVRARGVPVIAVAALDLRILEGLVSGRRHEAASLAGQRVVAASGTIDPDVFGAQVKSTGAAVQVAGLRDPVSWRDEDIAWLAKAARKADHVVIPERDAARLRDRWPNLAPEPLVALSEPAWDTGEDGLRAALEALPRGRSVPDLIS